MTGPGCPVSPLTIRLFGPFELRLHGAPLPRLRSRKGEWLLALLALRHNTDVERSWLAGTLWPDSPEPQAMANLRICLTDLRRALGSQADRLHSPAARTLSLDLSGAEVDVVTFDRGIAGDDASAWERAVALYRGPLLEGCAEEWVVQERAHREEAYLGALERLAAAAVERAEHGAAVSYLRRAVAVDPSRETAQRALMQALAASGNYAAAIQIYRELRLHLHRELNTEPDAETHALFEQLRAEARRKAASGVRAPGRSGVPVEGNLLLPERPNARTPERRSEATTVTFLFTDIAGSTRLWEDDPEWMREALARHDVLLRDTIGTSHGHVFKTMGDAFCVAFVTATDAVVAALAIQRILASQTAAAPQGDESRGTGPLRVRVVLHSGSAEMRDGDYFGPALSRATRLLGVAHGGQILLSGATQELVQDSLPPEVSLRDLGRHRLRDLQRPERLFQLVHPDMPAEFPPLFSLEVLPNNLPQQVTSFVGREREIAAVKRLLGPGARERRPVSLLTLTGPGGTGKTRLAIQVAAELLDGEVSTCNRGDGVWLVDLAPLSDPAFVPQAVASVLGIREEPGKALAQILVEALKPRTLLLLLDNCEHLLSACAEPAHLLLRGCPGVQILATSREALGIAGEQTYVLPSLSLPDPRDLPARPEDLAPYEATQLFIDRATASQSTFSVTTGNAAVVAQICRRLDGIPLAIELAAARIRALPPEQILRRLDDRFRLLTGGSRTALPRQQTLRALIDWSYDLLSEAERTLLRRLSVFAGGWILEAAEAVCADPVGSSQPPVDSRERAPASLPSDYCLPPSADVLDLLASLAEKSLVQFEEREGQAHYRLLETMRQYCRDRLLEVGEAAAVQDRHLAYFLDMAECAEPELTGPKTVWWLDRLEEEHDNLRAALGWSVERSQAETGLRLGGALQEFWWLRGYHAEGQAQLIRLLGQAGPEAGSAARARVLCAAGRLARAQRDTISAQRLFEEALAISRPLEDRAGIASALVGLGGVAQQQEDLETARARHEESLAIRRELGDKGGTAFSLHALGFVALSQGDLAGSRALHEESVEIWREAGDQKGRVYGLDSLGCVTLYQGDLETARCFFEQALALARKLGDKTHIAWGIIHLGWVAQRQQDHAAAQALYEQGLAIWRELGYKDGLINALSCLGQVARRQGDVTAAQERFAECLAICRAPGNQRVTAWLLLQLGDIAGDQRDWKQAAALFTEAIRLYRELRDEHGVACCLAALARLIEGQGKPERAAQLLGAAQALCDATHAPLPPVDRTDVDRSVAPIDHADLERRVTAIRAALDEPAFAAAWAQGRAMPVEQALRIALADDPP